MSRNGLIFDMDGTLWDSAENVVKSWNVIIEKELGMDRCITIEDMHGVMGLTMDKLAEALFPDLEEGYRLNLLENCCEYENEYLREHGGVLYPELRETLVTLRDEVGYGLYIVSNCQSGYIEAFLDYYNMNDLFDDIECFGNTGKNKGENIALVVSRNNLEHAIYVGDTMGDYQSSVEAGVDFIHASYGFGQVPDECLKVQEFRALPEIILVCRRCEN